MVISTNFTFLEIILRPVFIKNTFLFINKNTMFRRLDSVSAFKKNLLSGA
jgi:hypothetical protein